MALNYQFTVSPESKMRSSDRIFSLTILDDKKPKNSIGVVDPRLFKEGEDANRLHCMMDQETSLWSFKYDKGAIPAALTGMFTGLKQAKDHAERYFLQRNIKITEIKD